MPLCEPPNASAHMPWNPPRLRALTVNILTVNPSVGPERRGEDLSRPTASTSHFSCEGQALREIVEDSKRPKRARRFSDYLEGG